MIFPKFFQMRVGQHNPSYINSSWLGFYGAIRTLGGMANHLTRVIGKSIRGIVEEIFVLIGTTAVAIVVALWASFGYIFQGLMGKISAENISEEEFIDRIRKQGSAELAAVLNAALEKMKREREQQKEDTPQ